MADASTPSPNLPLIRRILSRSDATAAHAVIKSRFALSDDGSRLLRITGAGRKRRALAGRTVSDAYREPVAGGTIRYLHIHPYRYRIQDVVYLLRHGPQAPVPIPSLAAINGDWADARPENWREARNGFTADAESRIRAAGAASGIHPQLQADGYRPGKDGPVAIRGLSGMVPDPERRMRQPVCQWIPIAAAVGVRWPDILATPWRDARTRWPSLWALAHQLAADAAAHLQALADAHPGHTLRARVARDDGRKDIHRALVKRRVALLRAALSQIPPGPKTPPSALDTTPTLAPILAWALAEHAAGRLHDTAEQAAAAWLPARADAAAPMPTPAQTAPAEPEDDDLF